MFIFYYHYCLCVICAYCRTKYVAKSSTNAQSVAKLRQIELKQSQRTLEVADAPKKTNDLYEKRTGPLQRGFERYIKTFDLCSVTSSIKCLEKISYNIAYGKKKKIKKNKPKD